MVPIMKYTLEKIVAPYCIINRLACHWTMLCIAFSPEPLKLLYYTI